MHILHSCFCDLVEIICFTCLEIPSYISYFNNEEAHINFNVRDFEGNSVSVSGAG